MKIESKGWVIQLIVECLILKIFYFFFYWIFQHEVFKDNLFQFIIFVNLILWELLFQLFVRTGYSKAFLRRLQSLLTRLYNQIAQSETFLPTNSI